MPYSEVSITGYNSNPPEDDGTQASSNEVSWSKHKAKLGDPLKTAIETTQTNITTVVGTLEANLYAPSGTLMMFQQTAAPTNWTKQTTHNDKAIRIVSGAASSGGSTAFSSVLTSRTIAQGNLPDVNLSHSLSVGTTITNGSGVLKDVSLDKTSDGAANGSNQFLRSSTGLDKTSANLSLASGTVSGTVPLGGSGTAMDFAIQYVDVIIASKDA